MNIQIEKLFLHHRGGTETHAYEFKVGVVNVISGLNARGKTTFIHAVDYALGSASCNIDLRVREAIDWVGLQLMIGDAHHLFARHVPTEGDNSKLCYHKVLSPHEVDPFEPLAIPKKELCSAKKLLPILSRLLGADLGEQVSADGKMSHLSIRPLLDVLFQEYDTISNEKHLFRNQGNVFSKRALVSWLPFVTGIKTGEQMRVTVSLEDEKKNLSKATAELAKAQRVSDRWLAELEVEYQHCKALGLVKPEYSFPDDLNGRLMTFAAIVKDAADFYAPADYVPDDTAVKQMMALERTQEECALEIQAVQQRIDLLKSCTEQVKELRTDAAKFEKRLKLADWLKAIWQDPEEAPLMAVALGCAGEQLTEELGKLTLALSSYENSVSNREKFMGYKNSVERELSALGHRLSDLREKYAQVTGRIRARVAEDQKAREYLASQRAAFSQIGRVEKTLALAHALSDNPAAQREIEARTAAISELKQQVVLENAAEEDRKKQFDGDLGEVLTSKVRSLDLSQDMQSASASFDMTKLDVRLGFLDREEYLSERGSSNNHIAYHVAVVSALVECLTKQPESPLPAFAFFDQPTQAKNNNVTVVLALDKLMKSLFRSVEQAAFRWQPIVIDYLSSEYRGTLDPKTWHLVVDLEESGGFAPREWMPNVKK